MNNVTILNAEFPECVCGLQAPASKYESVSIHWELCAVSVNHKQPLHDYEIPHGEGLLLALHVSHDKAYEPIGALLLLYRAVALAVWLLLLITAAAVYGRV
jgi:hypothetical protein